MTSASAAASTTENASWFGHPQQLARLFSTEAMERFGFYGMRALLTLYFVGHFQYSDISSSSLYGGVLALVYLTPFIGGLMADRVLGYKRAVKFGALVMSLGYLLLCFGGEQAKPYAIIDGQRYEVTVVGLGKKSERFVTEHGVRLKMKGNDDKSISLLAADGHEARHIAPANFESGATRDASYAALALVALALISIGNGFFKPNISTMVGSLYDETDRRRDAGFAIFYMGINLGSLFSQILCPFLAVAVGWWAGFGLAAIGMLVAFALIQFSGGQLKGYGEPPMIGGRDRSWLVYAGTAVAVPLVWFLLSNVLNHPADENSNGLLAYLQSLPLLGKMLGLSFVIAMPGVLVWAWRTGTRTEAQMMTAAVVMILFNTVFMTLFEQAGSSLTLFANRNTNLSVFGLFSISAGQTQFFNAAFIVLLTPLFAWMWASLHKRGLEPSTPVKFALAIIGAGLGFLFLVFGAQFHDANYQVGLWWLAGLYLIHSIAELFIQPVGLSMISKLSIKKVVGLMFGLWFLSIAVAEFVAGILASLASVNTVGGEVTNLRVSLDTYTASFTHVGLFAVAAGVVMLILSPVIRKLMHHVN